MFLLQLVPHYLSFLGRHLQCAVTKAMPIHFIDGKCHIKTQNSVKSCKTDLPNHAWLSHHITPLVIASLGGGYTDTQTHTHMLTCELKQFQKSRHTPACSWHASSLKSRSSNRRHSLCESHAMYDTI